MSCCLLMTASTSLVLIPSLTHPWPSTLFLNSHPQQFPKSLTLPYCLPDIKAYQIAPYCNNYILHGLFYSYTRSFMFPSHLNMKSHDVQLGKQAEQWRSIGVVMRPNVEQTEKSCVSIRYSVFQATTFFTSSCWNLFLWAKRSWGTLTVFSNCWRNTNNFFLQYRYFKISVSIL